MIKSDNVETLQRRIAALERQNERLMTIFADTVSQVSQILGALAREGSDISTSMNHTLIRNRPRVSASTSLIRRGDLSPLPVPSRRDGGD